jgi:hypothetical protein
MSHNRKLLSDLLRKYLAISKKILALNFNSNTIWCLKKIRGHKYMLYIANLTSIILFVFTISFLVAEPWSKQDKRDSRVDSKQTAKLTKGNLR